MTSAEIADKLIDGMRPIHLRAIAAHMRALEDRGHVRRVERLKAKSARQWTYRWVATGDPPNRGRTPLCPTCGKPFGRKGVEHRHREKRGATK